MKKVLICADSFGVIDPRFPNLHWSEKLASTSAEIEIFNFSVGGASNALITMQLMQGLKFDPDFVIISFTNEHRYEQDFDINALPFELEPAAVIAWLKQRYQPNNKNLNINLSQNFEKIKSYFYILLCLQTLKQQQINFCFSLGGFEYNQDYTALIRSNYLQNSIMNYSQHELSTNLWYHASKHKAAPYFHVDKEEIHILFANECFKHINNNHA